MDKDQQMQTVANPEFPWSITLEGFKSGNTLKLNVGFTAQPGAEIEYSGLAKFLQGSSAMGEDNCGQKITDLQAALPVNCNAETTIP